MENFFGSLLNSIVQNWVWVVIVLFWGTLVGYLKAVATPYSHFADPLLYGLGAMVLASAVIALWKVNASLSGPPPTTIHNIESRIKDWIAEYGVISRRVSGETGEVFFQYDVTMLSGANISIARIKKRPKHLVFTTKIVSAPDTQAVLRTLDPEQLRILGYTVQMEASRNLDFLYGIDLPSGVVDVGLGVPLTKDFNDYTLIDSLDRTDNAIVVARNALFLTLKRLTPAAAPAAPPPPPGVR